MQAVSENAPGSAPPRQAKITDEFVLMMQGQTVQRVDAAVFQLGAEFGIPAGRDVVEILGKLHFPQGHKSREGHPCGVLGIGRYAIGKPELRLIGPPRGKEHAISAVTGEGSADSFQGATPERGNIFTGKRDTRKSRNELQIILSW